MDFNKIFSTISNKSTLDKESILGLANSIKNADLKDEKVLRKIIRDVAKLANRSISKEVEDSLVNRISKDGVPNDLSDLL